jgi:hypothetical protein
MQPKDNILHFNRKQRIRQQNLQHKNNATQESKVQNSMTPEGPLDDLIKFTSQWANEAISKLFDNVDTQLFEMAEKSENASSQNTYFDAMRIVRLRRSIAHEEFMSNVEKGFNTETILSEKTTEDVTTELDSLSLIDDDNLEEDLATHNMIAKADRDNKDAIKQLNQRLGYLYNGLNITNENNPIGPTSLCNSFSAAVDKLDADIQVKLLIYKLFDLNFISRVSELFEKANALLIGKGVLPDLKISYKSPVKRPAHPPGGNLGGIPLNQPVQPSQGTVPPNQVQPQESADLSQFMYQPSVLSQPGDAEAFALIQQLIAQNKPAQPQMPAAQYASTAEVVDSLAQVQTNPEIMASYQGQPTGTITSNLLKEALKQSLQNNEHKEAINQNDDDMIDVIGMLFDFILDDDNLVDSVKSLLSRLQIPIIKMALQDKSFFRNKSHPARKLLNELANAGLGVTDNVTAQDNPLYLKLENLVNRISNEKTQNIDINFFEELLDNLHRFLSEFNQGRRGKGKQRKTPSKDAALQLISTELSSRTHGIALPENIHLLLEKIWKDVMTDIFFHDGMESDEWDMAMTFVDTLIWSVNPKTDPQSQKQLVRVIPGILNALNTGLDRIQYPKNLREQVLQDLQTCHLACMKGKTIEESELSQNSSAYISQKPVHTEASAPVAEQKTDPGSINAEDSADIIDDEILDEDELIAQLDDGSEAVIADTGEAELIEDAFTQQARNLSPGAWVEFYGIDNQVYRAKISWMSEDAGAYIFVTQTGQIAEKSLQGLSDALRNKRATILDESPVFERAMDAVLEELQEKTEI